MERQTILKLLYAMLGGQYTETIRNEQQCHFKVKVRLAQDPETCRRLIGNVSSPSLATILSLFLARIVSSDRSSDLLLRH